MHPFIIILVVLLAIITATFGLAWVAGFRHWQWQSLPLPDDFQLLPVLSIGLGGCANPACDCTAVRFVAGWGFWGLIAIGQT